MTRCPLLCVAALLAYGMAVGCGPAGIASPHRPVRADEGWIAMYCGRNPTLERFWVTQLRCACGHVTYEERERA